MPYRVRVASSMRGVVLMVALIAAGCGNAIGSVRNAAGPMRCSGDINAFAVAVHLIEAPKSSTVTYGIYYGSTIIAPPGSDTTVNLTDPDSRDFSFPISYGSYGTATCYPPSGSRVPVASPDLNGLIEIRGPTTYTVKVIRPSDFTVLAQGDITVRP
jgi:hypothetical protein